MSYGFNVYNDDGSAQISTNFINYFFVGKGTYTIPSALVLRATLQIETGVLHDAVAVACDSWHVRGGEIKAAPTTVVTVTPDYGVRYGGTGAGAPAGTKIHYWLFRAYSSLAPSTTDVGLEVYGPAGQVAFSSRYPKIMRTLPPIPIYSLKGPNYAPPGDLYTLPQGGRVFAFMSYGVLRRVFVEPGVRQEPFDFAYPAVVRRNPQGFLIFCQGSRGGRSNTSYDIFEGGVIPVDVTGY